ncbi:MAG: CBS domain-containing protein [Oligoflexales bacterium]|nr:CBS domain-containing protein [Oligoflexales bacterium]
MHFLIEFKIRNAITLNELKTSLAAAKSKNIKSGLIECMVDIHRDIVAKNPDLDWTAIYDEINPKGGSAGVTDISQSDKKIFENLLAAKDKTPDYSASGSIEAFVKQPPLVISADLSLVGAAKQLASKNLSEAIFSDEKGNYMGVVSLPEIIRKMIIDEGSLSSKVSSDIVKKVPAIPAETSPKDGLKILDKFEVSLFAVQKNSRILGVVTQADLIKSIIARDNITSKAS